MLFHAGREDWYDFMLPAFKMLEKVTIIPILSKVLPVSFLGASILLKSLDSVGVVKVASGMHW